MPVIFVEFTWAESSQSNENVKFKQKKKIVKEKMENQESGTKTTTHTTKMLIFKILNQHEQWCKCVLSITTEECEDFKTIQIKRVGTVLRYCV